MKKFSYLIEFVEFCYATVQYNKKKEKVLTLGGILQFVNIGCNLHFKTGIQEKRHRTTTPSFNTEVCENRLHLVYIYTPGK